MLSICYLGGAAATHVRIEDPLWTHVLSPAYMGAIVWGLRLRHERLRSFVPWPVDNPAVV